MSPRTKKAKRQRYDEDLSDIELNRSELAEILPTKTIIFKTLYQNFEENNGHSSKKDFEIFNEILKEILENYILTTKPVAITKQSFFYKYLIEKPYVSEDNKGLLAFLLVAYGNLDYIDYLRS